MKHLLKYAKKYTKECICGPVFKLLEASFELCVPLVMKSIIDIGIAKGDASYIAKMTGVLVLLGALGLTATVIAQYFSAKAAVGIVSGLKRAMLGRIQSFSYTELDKAGISTLITRMTGDANQVQSGINLTLRLFMRSPFVVFGAMIMAFTVDTRSAITFAVVIPLLSLVVFGIMLGCIPLYKRVQQKLDGVLGLTRENLSGVRVIRAFCRQEAENAEFDKRCDELNSVQNLVGRISALMNPLTYILINATTLVLIYIGALQVDSGVLTQGDVVSLYNYMLLILVELIKLASLIITMTKSYACEQRIEAVLNTESSMQFGNIADTLSGGSSVEFRDVCLKYSGSPENSLEDISFSVSPGQTVGIIGSTGSGKTSLINLIPRFYDATEGCVLINGTDVKDYSKDALRESIGIVEQKAVLFRGTIRENLLWGKADADDTAINEAVVTAQAADIIASKKDGLDEMIEQNGRNLSGGQRQRLTIARAIVKRPSILIFDDSMSALDFATDASLRSALKELSFKPTVFIVSQRTASIMHADKIIVLEDGKAAGIGTHTELLECCEIYREIHESQFKKEGE